MAKKPDSGGDRQQKAHPPRQEREAQALRANLARRKAQRRQRQEADTTSMSSPSTNDRGSLTKGNT